ncbi:glycosyl hydrolase-related protein [Spirosoma sp. 209]|uniref:glycosyl hydrolase-related protein n=1 Tax=Spirosoma sp. 209 TaxID=1955701 RepID=UPI00098D446D|nr:glycosyl hydrolase-related protein [Spirosoma sp. 209]
MSRLSVILLGVVLLLLEFPLNAQPVKRLYLANDDHTDYMWTGNEAQYDTVFVRMLDYYLRQIDSTQHLPDDFQARFNCDGSYWLKTYQKFRSPAQFERLIGRIRSGHISSPLNGLVSTYGGQPTEAVLRGMYYAGQLERQWNLRFRMAVCMENQTLPLGLSSLWAGAGAKYSWRGVCGCASKISHESLAHRRNQLYRYMGQDGRSVIMKWYNRPIYNGRTLGGYAEARREKVPTDIVGDMGKVITDLSTMCDTVSARSVYPFNVAGAFGYGWDDLDTYVSPAFTTAAQRYSTATRRVRVSNEEDFFADVERTYPKLPTESVSYGNEWDLYPVSMNETTAHIRRATEKLRSAEGLAALVSLKDSTFARDLKTARDLAWEAYGLYWEHDWTADGPVSKRERANWQTKLHHRIVGYVDSLYTRAVLAMGQQLKANPGARAQRFYVFNPLNWSRNDFADVAYAGNGPVRVIDLQINREAISQLIQKGGKSFVRIWAENVPSVGYKVYEIQQGSPTRWPDAAEVAGEFIQNDYYRIRLKKSGVISELYDRKANNRQLVKPTYGRLLNDIGTTNPDAGNSLVAENKGPVSVTFKAVSNDPIAHTVRVTLFRNNRIDIEDSLQANFGDVKAWSFSLNLDKPTTNHEELGAILTAKKETRGGHYASQNARHDYQTFNHFADVAEPTYGVTISNQDCSFFKLGQSIATAARPDSLWETSAQLNALAGGQVDTYGSGKKDTLRLGIYNQNGVKDLRYHFALTTHSGAFDALVAMKFALEHQNPLVAGAVTGNAGTYPETTFSLLKTDAPGLLIWGLKPSEEGINNGLIARFWNLNKTAATPTLNWALPIRRAWQTTHIETNEQVLKPISTSLKTSFSPRQLNTYRIQF